MSRFARCPRELRSGAYALLNPTEACRVGLAAPPLANQAFVILRK